MCKYKVQVRVKLNLLDIINIFDLFLKSFLKLLKTCIVINCTCISIFSKIEYVDQSKPCTQIDLHNIAGCINLQSTGTNSI